MRTDKQQAGVSKLTHPLAVMDYRNYWYWFTLLYLPNHRSSCLIKLTPSVLSKRYYSDLSLSQKV